MLFEHTLPDYVLCDRQGAALETKRTSINPFEARAPGCHYAEQLDVPFIFLSNGDAVWSLNRETDSDARKIAAPIKHRARLRFLRLHSHEPRSGASTPSDIRVIHRAASRLTPRA